MSTHRLNHQYSKRPFIRSPKGQGGAHKWVRSTTADEAAATNDRQTVLGGPRLQYNPPKTSWKRQKTNSATATIEITGTDVHSKQIDSRQDSTPIHPAADDTQNGSDIESISTSPKCTIGTTFVSPSSNAAIQEPLRKVGSHKLVIMRQQTSAKEEHSVQNDVLLHQDEASLKERILMKMKKCGRHKLILAQIGKTANNENKSKRQSRTLPALSPVASLPGNLLKRSRNKLVTKQHLTQVMSKLQSNRRQGPVAKRIKLLNGTDDPVGGRLEPAEVSSNAPKDKLTDFAYRHTTKKVSARMGLVRVRPDADTTPICPTFMRGISCSNASCTKRHDVPRSAATPICSFFQHQGQCYKGTFCPFRHVKVSSQAMACPSFSLLGFCEDKNCKMKHLRQEKPKSCHKADGDSLLNG